MMMKNKGRLKTDLSFQTTLLCVLLEEPNL